MCHSNYVAVRLIPERTIDAWTSIAVNDEDPDALIWAPTPNAQARNQPWDLAVEGFGPPKKVVAYENKALEGSRLQNNTWRSSVLIRWDQLLALVEFHYLRDLPVYYGLPGLQAHVVQALPPENFAERGELRFKPQAFADWQRVLTPGEVLAVLPRRARISLAKNLKTAIAAEADMVKGAGSIPTNAIAGYPSLAEHLDMARQCHVGRRVDPPDSGPFFGTAMTDKDRVASLGPIVAGILERSQLVAEEVGAEISRSLDSLRPPSRSPRVGRHLMRTVWAALHLT